MVLNKDFREFIESLNARGVRYLVVGGYAVAYHGYPRYTKDIDFWIWMNQENAEKLLAAIHDFGFSSLELVVEDFLDAENVIQLGFPPRRIDLLTNLSDVTFEDCFSNREVVEIEGISINFIDLNSLIKTKLAAGRPQDKVDVDKLREQQNKNER